MSLEQDTLIESSPRPQSRGKQGHVQRDVMRVREVVGEVLCLQQAGTGAGYRYCTVLEVSGTNYALRSEDEQEAMIEGYHAFLKALTFPLQILLRNQRLDLTAYLAHLEEVSADATCSPTWRQLAKAHRDFVQELASRRTLLDHRFYVIIPAQEQQEARPLREHLFSRGRRRKQRQHQETLETARKNLDVRAEMVTQHFTGLGLHCHRLTGSELLALEYSCLTPERATKYPLTPQMIESVGRPKNAYKRGRRRKAAQEAAPIEQEEEVLQTSAAVPPPDFSRVVDLLAPASVEEAPDWVCVEGEYLRGIAITDCPREVTAGWLMPLILHDDITELVFHIHPQNSATMIRRLMRRKAQFRSAHRVNARRGRMDDPDAKVAEDDIDTLMGQLASGEERVFDTSLYVMVRANDIATLETRTERIMTVLHNLLLMGRPTTFEQMHLLHSFLPEAHNESIRTFTLDSMSLATTFPFISNSLYMPNGVLEGVTTTGEPVVIDDWDESLDNPHRFVGAITGVGKSYYAKLKIMRELLVRHKQGLQIAVIDPEQEYKELCLALGGDYIRLAPGSEQHLNPFDLLPPGADIESYVRDRSRGDRLAEKVQSLHALYDLLLANRGPLGVTVLSASEKGLLDRATYETYRTFGISADPRSHDRPVPLLRDLYTVLTSGVCGKDEYGLADRLYRYVFGSLSGSFAAPTDVQLTNHFVVFDVRDMSGELRPIGVFLIADFMWTQVLQSHQPRVLYIDEAWSLLQHPEGGRFLADLSRRARKRYLRLVTITQNPELFVEDAWGSVVAANAATKVLKKQDRTSAEAVSKRFQLTTGERQRLLTFSKPEALLLAGGKRVILTVDANPLEHALATTDPREMEQKRLTANRTLQHENQNGHDLLSTGTMIAQRYGEQER